ncbi:hypothetical protein B0H11DRAFT_50246 [Mycena galericulata]|nr:hypothetical protein B0H11DRAFT_50246 [Mycena galericulata]
MVYGGETGGELVRDVQHLGPRAMECDRLVAGTRHDATRSSEVFRTQGAAKCSSSSSSRAQCAPAVECGVPIRMVRGGAGETGGEVRAGPPAPRAARTMDGDPRAEATRLAIGKHHDAKRSSEVFGTQRATVVKSTTRLLRNAQAMVRGGGATSSGGARVGRPVRDGRRSPPISLRDARYPPWRLVLRSTLLQSPFSRSALPAQRAPAVECEGWGSTQAGREAPGDLGMRRFRRPCEIGGDPSSAAVNIGVLYIGAARHSPSCARWAPVAADSRDGGTQNDVHLPQLPPSRHPSLRL